MAEIEKQVIEITMPLYINQAAIVRHLHKKGLIDIEEFMKEAKDRINDVKNNVSEIELAGLEIMARSIDAWREIDGC